MSATFCIDVPDPVIARARLGELAAMEHLYRLFERPAWTLALRLCGNPEDAREIVHDAMLHVFERVGQFRGDSPFWGWVRRIVANEALMHLRRKRGEPVEEMDDVAEPEADSAPALLWSDAARLDAALNRLPDSTRSVIWLYHVEGYTHAEIAEMSGKSVSYSKSQLARGVARLRDLLGSSEVDIPCIRAMPVTA